MPHFHSRFQFDFLNFEATQSQHGSTGDVFEHLKLEVHSISHVAEAFDSTNSGE